MQLDGGAGSGARIDVTPMADVMIVLLIIFMVTAPVIVADAVRPPPARHASGAAATPLLVLRSAGQAGFENGPALPYELLQARLEARLSGQPEGAREVALRADRETDYATVRALLVICREAGAERVTLITARPEP